MDIKKKFEFDLWWYELTFDDVFLKINQKTDVKSRRNVDLSTTVKWLKLNIPIIWANMSTVMDWNFAKYLSLMWWIWILHQNCSIEEQIIEVNKVKRYWTPIILNPMIISPDNKISDVNNIFNEHNIWALIVVDWNKKVLWIITKRDLHAVDDYNEKVSDYMTNFSQLKYLKTDNLQIDIAYAEKFLKKSKVEQIPIINNWWKLLWLYTRKWFEYYNKFPNASRDEMQRLVVWAAVWLNRDPIERARQLISSWIDLLVLDTAHWWNNNFLKTLKDLRYNFPDIIIAAWNIDNPNAAIDFVKAWADILKVWIWPWWACKTRVQTWYWKPQLSAIWDIKKVLIENWYDNIKIIADWWIKQPWNLAKAIAAWANYWMMWSVFAWTDFAVWQLRNIDWRLYKDYRWMASFRESIKANRLTWVINNDYWPIFDEWADDIIPYKWDWSFFEIIRKFHWALASSLSYANSKNLDEFFDRTIFWKQTINWNIEWTPWNFK